MRFNMFRKKEDTVTNYEGAKAYKIAPEVELYAAVVTAGLSNTFYEKNDERIARIQELLKQNDAEYAAKLAVYTRNQMYMRSVPQVLAVELAKIASGSAIVSKTVQGVVKRADEITELLAYYQQANARTGAKKLNRLSRQVQKGLGAAFNSFDEYQFAKYDRSNARVKLRDALFLVHPKPKDEAQQAIFDKIAAGKLATPYTWETELSALGQQAYADEEAKAAAFTARWQELIDSDKLGYMALMRNLRNIIEANVSAAHMQKVVSRIADAQEVSRAKQLPFRFLAAYREVRELHSKYVTMVLDALEDAVKASVQNLRGFDASEDMLVACDVSGSMQKPISARSKILLYDIGLVLGMLLQSKCRSVVTGMFGDTWKVINMPGRAVLQNVQEYYRREGEVGYSTNGHLVIEDLADRKVKMDKVMIFTDLQLWNSQSNGSGIQTAWARYRAMYPEAKLYLFDLAGYGNTPLKTEDNGVYLVAGWSDKIFDVLQAIEEGVSVVEQIKKIQL